MNSHRRACGVSWYVDPGQTQISDQALNASVGSFVSRVIIGDRLAESCSFYKRQILGRLGAGDIALRDFASGRGRWAHFSDWFRLQTAEFV
jgi:hypothetical protein